jgi:hypothetical protein
MGRNAQLEGGGAARVPPAGDSRQGFARLFAWSQRTLLLFGIMTINSGLLSAQAAAEYGGAVSKSGTAAVSAPRIAFPADATKAANLAHLPARSGQASEDVNRRAFESRAGKDPAKLMLRSLPSKGVVRIDGKLVGKTPLFLVLAPGLYKIEIDGERMSSAEKQVDLLPHETRAVVMSLESRYPARLQLR